MSLKDMIQFRIDIDPPGVWALSWEWIRHRDSDSSGPVWVLSRPSASGIFLTEDLAPDGFQSCWRRST
jgi:hypothetical protein